MNSKELDNNIKNFFDEMSVGRDATIKKNLIVDYEQKMRQKGVLYLLNLNKNDFVLDIGCGNARDLLVLAEKGIKCVGIDSSKGMVIEGLKSLKDNGFSNIKIYEADAKNLPFEDSTFNKIILSETIEHIPNYKIVINECKRVLNKGGILVITTPNWYSLYGINRLILEGIKQLIKLIKPIKRVHPYDKWKTQREVKKVLEENGFKIKGKIGICFIPGYSLIYILPNRFKRFIIKITFYFEKRLNKIFTKSGYIIGISGIKI